MDVVLPNKKETNSSLEFYIFKIMKNFFHFYSAKLHLNSNCVYADLGINCAMTPIVHGEQYLAIRTGEKIDLEKWRKYLES